MRLLRLEISGFKSFCDKTVMNFVQDGVSVVVGPNGCGKSNIVDAVRWALGEQSAKHLRGGSMEDVIFSGSSVRQPVSMAQVTLIFSNPGHDTIPKYAEFSEISISRRLYRSGESQYLINKTPCRLTDIRELFMDTGVSGKGYSIIEQGKIDQIVVSRPEERRAFIDEAAGIVKFKAKRREAERKFAASKQNLLRVEDIIAELSRQEETLRLQVAQAEAYLNRKGRLERLQQCTAATRWYQQVKESEDVAALLEKNRFSSEKTGVEIDTLEVQQATLQLELSGKETQQEERRRSLQEMKERIIKLEGKLESDRAAIENLDEWQKKDAEESRLISRQIETLDCQIESHRRDAERFVKQVGELELRLNRLQEYEKVKEQELTDQQSTLENSRSEEMTVLKLLNEDQNRLENSREKLAELKQSEAKTVSQIAEIEADIKKLQDRLDAEQAELEQTFAKKTACQDQIESIQATLDSQEQVVKESRGALEKTVRSLQQADERYRALQDSIASHESFDAATRRFLDYLQQHPQQAEALGFEGTLAELVSPPKEDQPQAIAFLNRYFNLLVFSSVERLQAIVEMVDQLSLEQLQMFFLDLVEEGVDNGGNAATRWIQRHSGSVKPVPLADSFQTVDVPLFDLDRETLKNAGGLIDPAAAIMTRAHIFLLGKPGQTNQAELFFKRQRELAELEQTRQQLKASRITAEERLDKDTALFEEHRRHLDRCRKELIELDLDILGKTKERDARQNELDRQAGNAQLLKRQQEQLTSSIEALAKQIEALAEAISDRQQHKEAVRGEIQQLQTVIDGAALDRKGYAEELQSLRIQLAGLEEKQKNNQLMLERLETDQQQRKDQLAAIRQRSQETDARKKNILQTIEITDKDLPQQLQRLAEVENELKKASDDLENDRQRLAEIQSMVQKEQKKRNTITERIHKLDIRLAQLKQEAKNIEDNLFAESGVTPDELIETFDATAFDIEAQAEVIKQLKEDISGMDDVNLAAKKEYDTLKERLDFLTSQSADLEQSITALENSISKINQESKRRFKEAFRLINQQFNQLFPKLFGGGEAYLELTDEADLLESGVEIIAQPPGKKLQNMTLLSGGEKALTAIALVFSVFQIKPSPFCLLDEVDAPLDEANNERFNRHVKLLTENSQFIIITHNKKTMEIGDALFGVTMEEPGISKIVSVDYHQFEMDSESETALAEGF